MRRSVLLVAAAAFAGWVGAQPAPALHAYGFLPGERVPDVAFATIDGRGTSTLAAKGELGTVFITRDIECPVSQRYHRRILDIARRYGPRGYRFVLVDVTPHSPKEAVAAAPRDKHVATVLDRDRALQAVLRPTSTAEAFVVDRAGTLRYRGAIDDQYGLSHQRDQARAHWLTSALDAVAKGEEPATRQTQAMGCSLDGDLAKPGRSTSPVTYHNRISRIIDANCRVCHRAGGLAPMPLESYAQVSARRAIIDYMVATDRMPPWPAERGVGHWANDRSLSAREKEDLLAWLRGAMPEGDAKEAPLPRRFSREWNIGRPDAIVRIPEPIAVPAEGAVAYKYVYVPTDFGEDKWVTAVEIRPTDPRVVHHVIALLEVPGSNAMMDTSASFFGVTVPGSLGITFPEGTGKRFPRGSKVVLEIHYQPNGKATTDRTEVGLRFSRRPLQEVLTLSAARKDLVIPPNASSHEVAATHTFTESGRLLSLFPHMHLRGKAFRYDLVLPDGRATRLLNVPRFDFNWQSYYELAEPIEVPKGARLTATATYDNSRANPWNPDPSKEVRWGPQTYEEMMIGYFDFIPDKPPVGRSR